MFSGEERAPNAGSTGKAKHLKKKTILLSAFNGDCDAPNVEFKRRVDAALAARVADAFGHGHGLPGLLGANPASLSIGGDDRLLCVFAWP